MRRNTLVAVWLAGLLLAATLYVVGPDLFVERLADGLRALGDDLRETAALLGSRALDASRALAIALFVVFVLLALMATGRGLPGRGALVAVTGVFLFLVVRPAGLGPASPERWLEALALSAVAAGAMTRRLLRPHAIGRGGSGKEELRSGGTLSQGSVPWPDNRG